MPSKEYQRIWNAAHRDKCSAYSMAWARRNREKVRAAARARYKKNREQILAYNRMSAKRNPEKTKALRRSCYLKRRAIPGKRIEMALRGRIRKALRGVNKSARTAELIGCSIQWLQCHLINLWKPGMTWENYGEWHVDHRRPCASFDLRDPEQQRACFHWSNLQPLWAKENLFKGAKISLL